MFSLCGVAFNNGTLSYNGGPFPWCGISKPTAVAHLSLSLICLIVFLLLFFFGWVILVLLVVGFIAFLITGIVIFILALMKK